MTDTWSFTVPCYLSAPPRLILPRYSSLFLEPPGMLPRGGLARALRSSVELFLYASAQLTPSSPSRFCSNLTSGEADTHHPGQSYNLPLPHTLSPSSLAFPVSHSTGLQHYIIYLCSCLCFSLREDHIKCSSKCRGKGADRSEFKLHLYHSFPV